MFFTSLNGVNRFFPEQIPTNPKPPEVVITTLNLFSQPFRTDLNAGEAIELAYNKNYLSFDFAALDFTVPATNQYAYKMEGRDPDWIEAGTRRHADYPDLKPGSYTFRVKASNNSGVWNEQGTAKCFINVFLRKLAGTFFTNINQSLSFNQSVFQNVKCAPLIRTKENDIWEEIFH